MAYSRSGRGYTKPPAGAQVNWGHPLTQNLVAAYPFLERSGLRVHDLVHGSGADFETGVLWNGDALTLPATNAGSYTTGPLISNRPFSILLGCHDLGTHGTAGATFSMGVTGSARQIIIIRPQSTTVIRFAMWFDDLDATVPSILGRQLHLAFTLDPAFAQKTYDDGKLINSRTAGGFFNGTRAVYFGGNAINTEQIGATFRYVYIYDRALSPDELAWVKAEPYAMLTTPQARKYFVMAATGVPGIINNPLST
jgi:hypothetical protein